MLVISVIPVLSAPSVTFNRDVLPILSENCFFCHGPDEAKRKGDLRLDIREVALRSEAIVPGDADASLVIERIYASDVADQMPPPDSHRSLTEAQKQLLVDWVEQGAEYAQHWSLTPIAKQVHSVDSDQELESIDQIVFRELNRADLKPQPEAERTTLLRRVYFDLIGLPPSRREVQTFLWDTSEQAYERVVDDLLSRPEYGERMAVHWLDLARYADSNGFQTDKNRVVWPWKDWVIEAFNENLPYDDFVIDQLAGDLLPEPAHEQRLATAFNRLHQYKTEGGTILEEYRVEAVADRVNTFGTAFLGLTLECARCHDHKYDPISQKEYFQLFAFFDDIDELGVASHFGTAVPTPALALTDEETEKQLAQLSQKIEILLRTLKRTQDRVEVDALRTWWAQAEDPHLGLKGAIPFKFDSSNQPDQGRGYLFDGDEIVKTKVGSATRHDLFSISFWMRPEAHQERAIICHLSDHWTDAGCRGWELAIIDGKLRFSMVHFWPGNAISIETDEAIAEQEWMHVAMSYDGSSQANGMRLYVNGETVATSVVRDRLTKQITPKDFGGKQSKSITGVRWGGRTRDHGFKDGRIDDAFFFGHVLHPLEVAALFDPKKLEYFSGKQFDALGSLQLSYVQHVYTLTQSTPVADYTRALLRLRQEHGDVLDAVPEILTMQELDTPKAAYVLDRGRYDARGEEVFAATPNSLPAMEDDLPRNRLGLAKWLVAPENPLFARVAVNRFWMLCFGRGLVDTPEDFGLQGEYPKYPELLDQLANDFRKSDWDVKALMRRIVTSKTYRQRSIASAELMRDDPSNQLLARGPSHRLSGEMIRDSALAASNLLVKAQHAAPRKPYDLSEAFKPIEVGMDESLYYRSVYSLWKRSAPSPLMMAFDGVKRDVCSVKRQLTNTPLQSLVLLNGPQFVEAARVASEQAWNETQGDLDALIRNLSLRFISREPVNAEIAILRQLFDEQLKHFSSAPEAAEALLSVGYMPRGENVPMPEHAAATVLAQAFMNLDESVVKR